MSKRNKYQVVSFPNGRVYFLENELVDKAIKQEKEILIVCLAWSGGYSHVIGANKLPNYDGLMDEHGKEFEFIYEMYGYEVKNKEYTPKELSRFYKVIFTQGEFIYMNTRGQATSYQGGKFIDWYSSNEEVQDTVYDRILTDDEIFQMRKIVNTKMTIKLLKNDKDYEEKVQALISYGIIKKEDL